MDLENISAKSGNAPCIWGISSGKGGVGKTFISTSLALTVSKLGHTVLLVDFDLTGANSHTALGVAPSHLSLRHYFESQKTLSDVVLNTPYPRLQYIQGFWDSWGPVSLQTSHIDQFWSDLKKLDVDYVIIDLGTGSYQHHLDVFRKCDEKFLITNPEPTSIEKTYRFIESYICSTLKENSTADAYAALMTVLRDHRQRILPEPFSFKRYLSSHDGFIFEHFEQLSKHPIHLIVNAVRSPQQAELGHSMRSVCFKYYDLEVEFSSAIDFDNAVWQSLRNREPVLVAQPFTPLSGQFLSLCKHLIDPEDLRAVV
ncbi:MAG: P-loop NTPase [Bdellovibrionales bacterium]